MAYRVFFSGLTAFVEYNDFKYVDVLLLDPDAPADKRGKHKHDAAPGHHDGAHTTQKHVPQMSIRLDDLAEWNLGGVLHGCGWRHFDLTGKTVFSSVKNADRRVRCPEIRKEPLQKFPVEPFGQMFQVSFEDGIIDMAKVLGHGGQVHRDALKAKFPEEGLLVGGMRITARVRLPKGKLTGLAPVIEAPEPKGPETRRRGPWQIGKQRLEVLAEVTMFVPNDQTSRRIDVTPACSPDLPSFVSLRADADVAVWITNEPIKVTRSQHPNTADHFHHYFRLIDPKEAVAAREIAPRLPEPMLLDHAHNVDIPICPPALMHARR
jgi:hypothetical protein